MLYWHLLELLGCVQENIGSVVLPCITSSVPKQTNEYLRLTSSVQSRDLVPCHD
jgi:hypothetical protein